MRRFIEDVGKEIYGAIDVKMKLRHLSTSCFSITMLKMFEKQPLSSGMKNFNSELSLKEASKQYRGTYIGHQYRLIATGYAYNGSKRIRGRKGSLWDNCTRRAKGRCSLPGLWWNIRTLRKLKKLRQLKCQGLRQGRKAGTLSQSFPAAEGLFRS
ncbi:hypothetical protein ACH5RR_025668 [Cinchona calisaya]|uniref:Uncharacterized protein n=1 Tax=Cinchona calisaya TaxID=153742 RepID=A0ABD2Z286_9GENT